MVRARWCRVAPRSAAPARSALDRHQARVAAHVQGLGKTLQTTAILAAHTHEQRQKFAKTGGKRIILPHTCNNLCW
jgi:hypothetical protein